MKKLILIAFLFSATAVYTQNEQIQEVNAPVSSAIIYLDGAEVTHSKQLSLQPGRNKVVFTGLSSKLISKSVQVTLSNAGASILSVSDRINYMANQKQNTRIKQLQDSVTMLGDLLAQVRYDKDAFDIEKKMLLANNSIGGHDKGVAIAELKLAADFYRSRVKEINAEMFRLEKKEKELNEQFTRSSLQLKEANVKFNPPTAEVSILLSAPSKMETAITLKYIVNSAGWAPSYDLLAEDVNQPIELKYRAKVFNNTGVDWNDIKIKLSTSDPMQSAAKPEMQTWNVDYGDEGNRFYNSNYQGYLQNSAGYAGNAMPNDDDISKGKLITKDNIKYEQVMVSELSAEFDIKSSYSIPSDAKPYIVDVTEYKLPATYQHFSIPKIDRDAFLLARIAGWEDLNLVEGPANVYYSNTYVGQSYIYTRSIDDTLDLSLGRDNRVLVTRSKLKDFSSKKLIGTNKKETYSFEMVVKNNRKFPVTIEVQDQIPISKQSDIIVDVLENSKADMDVITGKLKWNYTLQPGESQKILLTFSVKYPKNKSINSGGGQQYKMRTRAKF